MQRFIPFLVLLLLPLSLRADAVAVGTPVTLAVSSDGTEPIRFEWFKNSAKIAEGGTLRIDHAATTDAGTYTVRASNLYGESFSVAPFVLEVGVPPSPPVIKATFGNVTALKQTRVIFEVVALGDSLKYSSRKDSTPLFGNGPTYVIAKVNPSHAGVYSVTVSNSAGFVTTSGRLTVR